MFIVLCAVLDFNAKIFDGPLVFIFDSVLKYENRQCSNYGFDRQETNRRLYVGPTLPESVEISPPTSKFQLCCAVLCCAIQNMHASTQSGIVV